MTETNRSTLAPMRVLVVENDPQWRTDHLENLRSWGYAAYAAEPAKDTSDRFQSLWDDAIEKDRRHRCHLAVVDMRLKNDDDSGDTSGLLLAPQLAPTVSIVVSGYGDRNTVRAAMKSPPEVPKRAYDFVGKEDGPQALLSVIKEVEQAIWCRREMDIICPHELRSVALLKRFFPDHESIPPDQVDDVLRCLFSDAERLKIEAVKTDQRTSGVLLRHRSIVVRVFEDDFRQPVIVKIARQGRIKEEIVRFNRVRRYFPGDRCAAPQGNPVELWDIGGTVYRLIDSDENRQVVSFSAYYVNNGPDDIEQSLVSIEQLWHHLYTVRPEKPQRERQTVFTAYNEVWGDEWCDRLLEYQAHELLIKYPNPFSQLHLPNPISWLIKKIKLGADRSYDDGGLPYTEIALTHGDLHGDNVFVDKRHDVWIIDYERTGFGPISQDWVELENDIVTNLAEISVNDWHEYFRLLGSLLSADSVKLPEDPSIPSARFEKEWLTVRKLRELAAISSGTTDARPYLWGLLLNTLFRMTLLLREHTEWKQQGHETTDIERVSALELSIQRCQALGGMICYRLDHWDRLPKRWFEAFPGTSNRGLAEQNTPSLLADPAVVRPESSSVWPDIVVVTALPEERDAILGKLPGYYKLPPTEVDIATCYRSDIPVVFADGKTSAYRVVIAPLLGMGRVKAAAFTASSVLRWHPRYIILVGIAGGVRLGDIIVSDQVVDYELQKQTSSGNEVRWEVHRADPRLLNASQNLTNQNWKELVRTKRPVAGEPKLHVGPIASGDKVVAFGEVLDRYRESWPKLIGVEMEAGGVATAAFQSPEQPGFFMIRCVSDLADKDKNTRRVERWRSYACDAAASFAIALLKSGPVVSSS